MKCTSLIVRPVNYMYLAILYKCLFFYLIMSSNDTTRLNFLFNPHGTKCMHYKLGTQKISFYQLMN